MRCRGHKRCSFTGEKHMQLVGYDSSHHCSRTHRSRIYPMKLASRLANLLLGPSPPQCRELRKATPPVCGTVLAAGRRASWPMAWRRTRQTGHGNTNSHNRCFVPCIGIDDFALIQGWQRTAHRVRQDSEIHDRPRDDALKAEGPVGPSGADSTDQTLKARHP